MISQNAGINVARGSAVLKMDFQAKLRDARIDMQRFCIEAPKTLDLDTAIIALGYRQDNILALEDACDALGGTLGN